MKKIVISRRALLVALTILMSAPIWADQGYAVLTSNGDDVVITEGTGANAKDVTYPGEGKTLTFYYGTPTGTADADYFNTDNTGEAPGWFAENPYITKVVFDASYDDARPKNCRKWFYHSPNLTTITGIEYLHTDNVKSMLGMFSGCKNLTSLVVTGFNTSNVTTMSGMFQGCNNLTTLNVSGFDTSAVKDMSYMFSSCVGLQSLNVTNFDTSSVTDMTYMFNGCSNLSSLNVTGFKTSNVTSMWRMFSGCSSLPSLDVTNFDTSNVENMNSMFGGCSSLPSLDVTGDNFKTAKVIDMGYMFSGCSKLPSLDVSHFDTSIVKDMSGMFNGCSSLPSLDVTNFDTSSVTNMQRMFMGCSKLSSLDVSNFVTSNVTNMSNMFANCSVLSLDVSNFDTSNVTNMHSMFYYCRNMQYLNLDPSKFITSKVTDMAFMFNLCNNLQSIDMSGFDTSNVTDMASMFSSCNSLTSLDVSKFDTKKVTDMRTLFNQCSSLTSLTFGKDFSTESVQTYHKTGDTDNYAAYDGCKQMWGMFAGGKLRYIDFYNSEDVDAITSVNLSDVTNMFYGTSATTVIYLPKSSGEVKNVTNVVYSQNPGGGGHGGGATNYILRCPKYYSADKVDIEFPRDFKTNEATYTRTMSNNYGSAILPYAFTTNENIQAYKQDKEYADINMMFFKDVETVAAHTPFAFKKLASGGIADFTMTDSSENFGITVYATRSTKADEDTWTGEKGAPYEDITGNISQDSNLSGWSTKGYYVNQTLNSNTDGPFFYIAQEKFKSANGNVTLPPHRVSFHNANQAGAKNLDIMTSASEDEVVTAIKEAELRKTEREAEAFYDTAGRRVERLQPGINIVRMTDGTVKKVIIR